MPASQRLRKSYGNVKGLVKTQAVKAKQKAAKWSTADYVALMASIIGCLIITIFIFIGFATTHLPIIVADTPVFHALSVVFVSLYRNTLPPLALLIVVSNIAIQILAFYAWRDVEYAELSEQDATYTLGNGLLNRTILDADEVTFAESWLTGVVVIEVCVVAAECVVAFFLSFHILNLLCCSRGVVEKAEKIKRKFESNVVGPICLKRCPNVIQVGPSPYQVPNEGMTKLDFLVVFVSLLTFATVFAYHILVLAAFIEKIPFWTTSFAPHFILVIGLLVWTLPPFGVTHETVVEPEPTDPPTWTTTWRYFWAWPINAVGLSLSTWILVKDSQMVSDSGAKFLDIPSYETILNGNGTNELAGGYGYSCTGSIPKKLSDYAMGHHVLEMMMVMFGYLMLVIMSGLWVYNQWLASGGDGDGEGGDDEEQKKGLYDNDNDNDNNNNDCSSYDSEESYDSN